MDRFCRQSRNILLLAVLLLAACRKMSAPNNAFETWQRDYQGTPLTAVDFCDGLNLFMPPAPVFFAAKRRMDSAEPPPRKGDLGTAREDLDRYCQAWTAILQQKLPPQIELPAAFSLPPPPWMTVLQQEDFQTTGKFLYQALGRSGLTSEQKKSLELLVLVHEQQRQLAETTGYIDKINRGQDCDLPAALRNFRIFQAFRQQYAAQLQQHLAADLLLPAQMLDEFLQPLLQLPQLEIPVRSLASLWMAIRESGDRPVSAEGKTLQDWRDLQPEPLRFAAIWEDLQAGTPPREVDHATWLVMSFPGPEPEPGLRFFLIFLPLPEQTEVFLNGVVQAQTPGQPLVLELPPSQGMAKEQLLAVRFQNVSLGSPLWSPWIVKQKAP